MNIKSLCSKHFGKFVLGFCLCGMMLPQNVQAEPRPILTSWEDVEIYDLDSTYKSANPNAPKGGVLRLTTIGSYDNFHIFAQRGRSTHYFFHTYETLGEALPDVPHAMRGVLAESFDLSDDRQVLKVKINPLAKFADGSPVRAQDVVFTYNSLQNDGNPLFKIGYQDVESVVAESDSTVVFKFKEGASRELPLDVCTLPIFAEKWWEGRDFAEPQHEPILASGPFVVKDAEFGVRFSLKRNPNYWAKDLPRNKGKFNFDEVIIDYYQDATVAREAFFAGEADFYSEGNLNSWHNAYEIEPVKTGKILRKEIEMTRPIGIMGLQLNLRRDTLKDKNIRQALLLLLDFERVNKTMYHDSYTRIDSYFTGHNLNPESMPTKEELEILNQYKDKLDPAVFGELPKLPVTDGTGNNRKQMRESLTYFKKAGWNLKDGKMLNDKGEQLELKLIASSQTILRNFSSFADSLSRVGVKLNLQLLDQNQYNEELKNFNYDMVYAYTPINYNPGNELRYYWKSDIADIKGSKNFSGIKDPVVDDLIERMVRATSLKELNLYTKVLDRIMLHGIYVLPTWYSKRSRISWWNDNIRPGTDSDMGARATATYYWYDPRLLNK